MEQLFKEHQNLIRKSAWYYARKYNLEFEELCSEGYVIFVEAVTRFNTEQQVKFSTFLYHRLRKLNDFCRKLKNYGHYVTEDIDDHTEITDDDMEKAVFMEAVDSLSQEGKKLLDLILAGTFIEPGQTRIFGKSRLKKVMHKEYGLSSEEAHRTVEEIQAVFLVA